MIARAADGSMRDALSLTDQVTSLGEGSITAEAVRAALGLVPEDEYLDILDIIVQRRAADVFTAVRRLADEGVDFGIFLAGFSDVLRAQLAVLLGGSVPDVSAAAAERLRANSERLASGDVLRMLNVLSDLEPRFRKSGQQQLLIELLLVRFALLDHTLSLEEVLRGMGPGSGAAGSGTAGGGASGSGTQVDWRATIAAPETVAPGRSAPASEPPRTASREAARAPAPQRRAAGGASPLSAMRSAMEASSQGEPPQRLSDDQLRSERAQMLRAKDPILGAAIDALDLELLD